MINDATDLNGRPWAKISETREGDWLEPDKGFTCMEAGIKLQVCKHPTGLFVACENGMHFISGQADDGEHIIGLYKADR